MSNLENGTAYGEWLWEDRNNILHIRALASDQAQGRHSPNF